MCNRMLKAGCVVFTVILFLMIAFFMRIVALQDEQNANATALNQELIYIDVSSPLCGAITRNVHSFSCAPSNITVRDLIGFLKQTIVIGSTTYSEIETILGTYRFDTIRLQSPRQYIVYRISNLEVRIYFSAKVVTKVDYSP